MGDAPSGKQVAREPARGLKRVAEVRRVDADGQDWLGGRVAILDVGWRLADFAVGGWPAVMVGGWAGRLPPAWPMDT